jgi:hypothetical protein
LITAGDDPAATAEQTPANDPDALRDLLREAYPATPTEQFDTVANLLDVPAHLDLAVAVTATGLPTDADTARAVLVELTGYRIERAAPGAPADLVALADQCRRVARDALARLDKAAASAGDPIAVLGAVFGEGFVVVPPVRPGTDLAGASGGVADAELATWLEGAALVRAGAARLADLRLLAGTATVTGSRSRAMTGFAARIGDPLWMLARQWQLGELTGSDSGSPTRVDLVVETARLTRYRPAVPGRTPGQPLDPRLPLESVVEAEVAAGPADDRAAAAAGADLVRRLSNMRQSLVDKYALPVPPADADPTLRRRAELLRRRVPDGRSLYSALVKARDGGDITTALHGLDRTEPKAVEAARLAAEDWLEAWTDGPAAGPIAAGEPPPAWRPERVDYAFSVAAPCPAKGGERVLVADGYTGERVDWWSLDAAPGPPSAPPATASRNEPRRRRCRPGCRCRPARRTVLGVRARRRQPGRGQRRARGPGSAAVHRVRGRVRQRILRRTGRGRRRLGDHRGQPHRHHHVR